MKFTPLASSSHGNCYVAEDGETRILLECGITRGRIRKLTGCRLSEFAGCLVTHEHKDHAKSVKDLLEDGMAVYMSQGTALALDLTDVQMELAEKLEDRVPVQIGTLDVVPFATFHDAAEPLGFLIRSRLDGEAVVFATDTVNLRYHFPEVTILAIEANYDRYILERCQRMPEKVKHRITCSHMEIDTLCDYLRDLDLRRCREIWLLHLSDATSHQEHFINKVRRAVPPLVRVQAAQK